VGVWAKPTPPHRPVSFLAVAHLSSLLGMPLRQGRRRRGWLEPIRKRPKKEGCGRPQEGGGLGVDTGLFGMGPAQLVQRRCSLGFHGILRGEGRGKVFQSSESRPVDPRGARCEPGWRAIVGGLPGGKARAEGGRMRIATQKRRKWRCKRVGRGRPGVKRATAVARSVTKMPWFLRGSRIGGGWGFAPTTTYSASLLRARGIFITLLGVRGSRV